MVIKKFLGVVGVIGLGLGISGCSSMSERDEAFVEALHEHYDPSSDNEKLALVSAQKVCELIDNGEGEGSLEVGRISSALLEAYGPPTRFFIMHATFKSLCPEHRDVGSEWRDKSIPGGW